ncbi:outer membrane protein [Neptunitalea chrysea]|uniref:Outer membrane protein n=1 Tax=Neptunitalea chrysea TaxID=1647581 RepID=A0A9W6B4B3_9FLAO|nr:G-D-S-L family lipolytic protein [Neptunitalea chrysea]GLB51044.1 outer membrane protein [Neptunitalea chrysea]
MKYSFTYGILLSLLLVVGCSSDDVVVEPTEEDVSYTSGSADFTTFVALGNSLTAGYCDGALSLQSQESSLPNILSQQFALAGGGDFTQPLVSDNLGGVTMSGVQIFDNRLILSFANYDPAPVNVSGTPTTDITNVLSGSYNNMGVPGAKIFHLTAAGYGSLDGLLSGTANPFFVRFASSTDASVISDAMVQNPTFFSLWIGNNDVLSYARGGGVGEDQTGNYDPTMYGSEDITDPTVFGSVYNDLLAALTANGAKGVVANIPDITTIPYFTTVPYNPIPLDAATAATINDAFAAYNGGLQLAYSYGMITADEMNKRMIVFAAGENNAMLMEDEYLTDLSALGMPNYRLTTQNDLIVLTAQGIIGTTVNNDDTMINGVSVPLGDKWVLTPEEQLVAATAQTSYNLSIETLASSYGLAFVDVEGVMYDLANGGITVNGSTLTSTYATGGAFSLDGVHPSSRGYAYLSNVFIAAINSTYGSNLPEVDLLDYTALYLE